MKERRRKVISLDKREKEESFWFPLYFCRASFSWSLFCRQNGLLSQSLHLRINQLDCQVKGNMTNTSLLNHQLPLSLSFLIPDYSSQRQTSRETESLTVDFPFLSFPSSLLFVSWWLFFHHELSLTVVSTQKDILFPSFFSPSVPVPSCLFRQVLHHFVVYTYAFQKRVQRLFRLLQPLW